MQLHRTSILSLVITRTALCVAAIGFAPIQRPLNAQVCATVGPSHPPCVLTQGYAGPPTDANFNSRQAFNGYETTLTPSFVATMATTHQLFLEVDDSAAALPPNAASNPILAQPLYVAGITVPHPAQGSCDPCDMVIGVTLNDTVFAWTADGKQAGNLLWSRQGVPGSTGNPPGNAGNALWYDDCGSGGQPVPRPATDTTPFDGILSTPAIDVTGSTPAMFLTDWCQVSTGKYEWFIHKINLQTGADATPARWIGGDFGSAGFNDINEKQRAALLEVPNPRSGGNPLIYAAFGTGTMEDNATEHPYHGWLIAYTTEPGTGALSPQLGFSSTPTSCGKGGGTVGGGNNGQCKIAPNSLKPGCDCYEYDTGGYQNAPNWGGQGGGCWMSGHGPAATAVGAIRNGSGQPDGDVHIFLGCGNGGFQLSDGGLTVANAGQTVMDFLVTPHGHSSLPFQSFTPNSPAAGVGPPALPSVCRSNGGPDCAGCGPCKYTFQAMNIADWDQSTAGLTLFNDLAGNPRLVTADKAGYGYLLTPGNLCAAATADTQCAGFAPGDPGSWTFGASLFLPLPPGGSGPGCTNTNDAACDRVTGMAFYPQSPNQAAYLYFWPYNETIVALQLSDNATTFSGLGPLTWSSGASTTLNYTLPGGESCTTGENCLNQQIIPGDTLQFQNCPCSGSGCPVVTSVAASSLTVNTPPPAACAAGTPQNFSYSGYFVNPSRYYVPQAPRAGFPGGAITVSAQPSGSGGYVDGLVWAVAPNASSSQGPQRGLGTLSAYYAVPSATQLERVYASTDVWCSASYAVPIVANGNVFVPTFAVSTSANSFTSCPTSSSSASPPASSGILVYY